MVQDLHHHPTFHFPSSLPDLVRNFLRRRYNTKMDSSFCCPHRNRTKVNQYRRRKETSSRTARTLKPAYLLTCNISLPRRFPAQLVLGISVDHSSRSRQAYSRDTVILGARRNTVQVVPPRCGRPTIPTVSRRLISVSFMCTHLRSERTATSTVTTPRDRVQTNVLSIRWVLRRTSLSLPQHQPINRLFVSVMVRTMIVTLLILATAIGNNFRPVLRFMANTVTRN
mmetsp:Transcript_51040/g.123131  ORF Transcript_51040/g.123131 Transcript_51040/m.123131 type:complete len:226 (-) Transcript_51040:611-1288(-)